MKSLLIILLIGASTPTHAQLKNLKILKEKEIEIVVLAGFMRLLTPEFIESYRNKILNIHPSLLPLFPGAHAHRDAITHGAKISGCTAHFVDEGIDTGPIIMQKSVNIDDDETERLEFSTT